MAQFTRTKGTTRYSMNQDVHRNDASEDRCRWREWLLLYRPMRKRAWPCRVVFYILVLFVLILSLAALGAYVGPEHTLSGVPSVPLVALQACAVRKAALWADAALKSQNTGPIGCRLSDIWPFPLAEPPPRRLVRGYLFSIAGSAFMFIGLTFYVPVLFGCLAFVRAFP